MLRIILISGADPGFQVRGGALKKIAKFVWAFRMKNHDFTPKNHIFSNFGGGRAPGAPPPLNPPLATASLELFAVKKLM